MEHACFEFNQVSEHLRGKPVALLTQRRQSRQELRIFQLDQSILGAHVSCLSRVISTLALAVRCRFWQQNGFEIDRALETLA
jgi:hypothetical protein